MRVAQRGGSEQGQALVLALTFLAVFGLLISFVLSYATVNLKLTKSVEAKDEKVHAANVGIESGIQRLRLDPTLCAGTGAPSTPIVEDLPSQTINNRLVEVTCQTVSGFSSGGLGWAVITTEPSGADASGLQTQAGVGDDRVVDGPVFSRGISNAMDFDLVVKAGDVVEQRQNPAGTTCDTDADIPAGLTVTPPYHYHCVEAPPPASPQHPDPPHVLPAAAPGVPLKGPDDTPSVNDSANTCRTFYPGKYTSLALEDENYFVSGTYYLENVDLAVRSIPSELTDPVVVAGRAHPDEVVDGFAPCVTVNSVDPISNGTGAKFILGGTSRILVDDKAKAEIFARCPPAATGKDPCDPFLASAEGSRGISVMAVPPPPAPTPPSGWMVSYTDLTQPIIATGSGTNSSLAIHGLVYAPSAFVDFRAASTGKAQLFGGVVAGRLLLKSPSKAPGLVVSTRSRPGVRQIIVTSTARGVNAGDRDLIARAVVRISNNPARTATVQSWRTDL